MAGWERGLLWVVAVLSGAAAVGLGLVVWLVDLKTAGQAGSVAGAVISLISLTLSVYALRQQSGSSGAGVDASGDGAVAARGSIGVAVTGSNNHLPGPEPTSTPSTVAGSTGPVRASGRGAVGAGGDIGEAVTGDGNTR